MRNRIRLRGDKGITMYGRVCLLFSERRKALLEVPADLSRLCDRERRLIIGRGRDEDLRGLEGNDVMKGTVRSNII